MKLEIPLKRMPWGAFHGKGVELCGSGMSNFWWLPSEDCDYWLVITDKEYNGSYPFYINGYSAHVKVSSGDTCMIYLTTLTSLTLSKLVCAGKIVCNKTYYVRLQYKEKHET